MLLPEPGEYVALGAARQAAWALAGTPEPPPWSVPARPLPEATPATDVRAAYAATLAGGDRLLQLSASTRSTGAAGAWELH